MPTRRIQPLPLPFQVAQRETEGGAFRWYLQRQRDDGTWEDIGGPYKERGGAVIKWRRLMEKEKSHE